MAMKARVKVNAIVFAALFVGIASAAETWDMSNLCAWSHEKNAVKLVSPAEGVFEVRHTGTANWSVSSLHRIAVKRGDAFELECRTEALADMSDSRPITFGAILLDDQDKPIAWSYGGVSAKPGDSVKTRFMIPSGVSAIRLNVLGGGLTGVRVRDARATRSGNIFPKVEPLADCGFANGALRGSVVGAGFQVEDLRTGRVWKPSGSSRLMAEELSRRCEPDGTVCVDFIHPETMKRWRVAYHVEKDRPEVVVTIDGEGDMAASFNCPSPFASRKGDRLIIPMNEGIGYPVDEPDWIPDRLNAYRGHGICMSFFGVQDDAAGAGWMAILETPDDASLATCRDPETKLWTLGPSWEDQKGRFGYVRRVRYVFFDKGGYVAMCKRYRAYAKETGRFKPFSEKARERPHVDRLLGAANIWCYEKDKMSVVSNLVEAGIDRFLWSAEGSAEEVKAMAAMPKVLVGRYDNYQDVYHPEQLRKLGWNGGYNSDAWPADVIWNSADSNDWRRAWGVKAKDGTWTYCARMCDRMAPAHERRNVANELKTKPYNARFIDTTVSQPWQTCSNPAHPMTRSDSRHWRMELLRILGDEFKLVVGSETGHDASVPFCDYYEGMLSLGPYMVPDSGRNMSQIWTNVPPRLAKYQVGEAYRLPLWELVYHECVCAHWYWGDYNNKLPEIWWKRDLFNVLYGTMGMYMFDNRQWEKDKEKFVRSYQMTSPVARATGYSEMTDHRILTPDRKVQESRFADGTVVTVNFGDAPYKLSDGSLLAARSHRASLGRCKSEVTLGVGAPFADHAVLQRDRAVPVWGTAAAGERVMVMFAGQEKSVVANQDGTWRVDLDPLAACAEGREMTVRTAGGETRRFADILVGEVWFCAGQSNAEVPLCGGNPHFRDSKGAMRAQITRKPLIRFCQQSSYSTSVEPRTTPAKPVVWKTFTPNNLLSSYCFSAMGVYFALEIHNALGIPVGIVGTYWGGTRIEPWIPASGLESVESCIKYAKEEVFDAAVYKAKKDAGLVNADVQWQPRVIWNEMVAPWTPFAIRGFIWYQGCSNAHDGHKYVDKMQALYNGWSKEFQNPGLKLYFVQLAPWGYDKIAAIQEGQALFAVAEKNAGMVVINDCGNLFDIHPNDKETVGQRLALLALKRDYGFCDIKADSPTLKEWKIEGDKFVLSFNDAERWYLYRPDFSTNSGFEIAGADGRFVPATIVNLKLKENDRSKSNGAIEGKTLFIRAEGIVEPKKLRYLHSYPWHGALHNEVDLPLGAFHIGE